VKRDALLASARCSLGYVRNAMRREAEAIAPARAALAFWTSGPRARGAPEAEALKAAAVLGVALLNTGGDVEGAVGALLARSDAHPRDPARIFAQTVRTVLDEARARRGGPRARASALAELRRALAAAEGVVAAAGPGGASAIERAAVSSAALALAMGIARDASASGSIDPGDAVEALALVERAQAAGSAGGDADMLDDLRASLLGALGRGDEAAAAAAEGRARRQRGGVLGCATCGTRQAPEGAPLLKCGGCARVVYCGAECQRGDWKRHKAECKERRA
jgi:hypothetical protein